MINNFQNNLINNNHNLNNNNQNNNLNLLSIYINNCSSKMHRTGLINIGQICYMNSTIQCLSNIKSLTKDLLKKYQSNQFNSIEHPLALAYSNLLFILKTSKDKYIDPTLFKSTIGELNPLFKGMHPADAKDLFFFIIEKLHQELNKPIALSGNNQKIDFRQQEIDSQDEIKTLKNFLKDFKLNNQSILSNIFYGYMRSKMKCNGCGITKYSFQTFNLLIFQLKKVKEFKRKLIGGNNYYNLNLIDSFECEKQEEILDGDNMIYCNNCKGLRPGIHQQSIYLLPNVIIIILNRGRNNQDFNEEFVFPKILDLTDQNIIIQKDSFHKFYLCGIITHLGESGAGGHFIAYCRNNPESNFLCYNDAQVSEVSIEVAMSSKISNNEYEKKTPYILLYHFMKDKETK